MSELQKTSAKTKFDTLQTCFMTVRQIKHYYRYGELRQCTQEKQDFYFHMDLLTSGKSDVDVDRLLRERDEKMFSDNEMNRPTIGKIWEARRTPLSNFPPDFE